MRYPGQGTRLGAPASTGRTGRREAKLPRRLTLRSFPVVPGPAVFEEGVDGGGGLVEHTTHRLQTEREQGARPVRLRTRGPRRRIPKGQAQLPELLSQIRDGGAASAEAQ